MKAALALAAAWALTACGGTSEIEQAMTSPALCQLPGVEASYERMADLPPPLAEYLLSRFADVPTLESAAHLDQAIAPRGGYFNGSGTRSSLLPNRRFVEALKRGDDIAVMYEHGGGPHLHVVLYRRDGESWHAHANVISAERVHCETAARVMANPRDPALWFSRIDW